MIWPLVLFFLLSPVEESGVLKCEGTNYPAIVTIYDPALGGINCDEDCKTLATGPLERSMYTQYAACDVQLLGWYVSFPVLDMRVRCMDTGGAVKAFWSFRDGQCVLPFDILWPLTEEPAPYWNWWFIEEWE